MCVCVCVLILIFFLWVNWHLQLHGGDSNPDVVSREGESTKILSSPATPHGTPILERVGYLEEQAGITSPSISSFCLLPKL